VIPVTFFNCDVDDETTTTSGNHKMTVVGG
jgi:hypothetical protein